MVLEHACRLCRVPATSQVQPRAWCARAHPPQPKPRSGASVRAVTRLGHSGEGGGTMFWHRFGRCALGQIGFSNKNATRSCSPVGRKQTGACVSCSVLPLASWPSAFLSRASRAPPLPLGPRVAPRVSCVLPPARLRSAPARV